MSAVMIDRRIFNIDSICSEDDIFQYLEKSKIADKDIPSFSNPFDGLSNEIMWQSMPNTDLMTEELERVLKDCEDDAWRYAEKISLFYETIELSSKIREQCKKILQADEEAWIEWLAKIPYAGIQNLCLYQAHSLEILIKFMRYIAENATAEFSWSRLTSMVIMTFMDKLKRIDDNIHLANRPFGKLEKFKWDEKKWEKEADNYIENFVKALFEIDASVLKKVLYSMLSNFYFFDEKRKKYHGKVRDEIIAQIATRYGEAENIWEFLQDSRWKTGKPAVLHKLFIYAEWTMTHETVLESVHEFLWEQTIKFMELKNNYMHYSHPDDWLQCWLCGKLLSDSPEPLKKISEILSRYHIRLDGWSKKKSDPFQIQRAQYFFLASGAMACEWLLRYNRQEQATEMIRFIQTEGELPIYELNNEGEDQYNFLLQLWARRALFMTKDTPIEEAKTLTHALNFVDSMEYRLTALETFFHNLRKEQTGAWLKECFRDDVIELLDRDLALLKDRNERTSQNTAALIKKAKLLKEKMQSIS